MTATNGRRVTLWTVLDRHRSDRPGCPYCHIGGDEPMTLNDALAAVVADGKTDAAGFEIRECTRVPDRVHVVFPPGDETGPRT